MTGKTEMRVGHINLANSFNGAGKHFVKLIESLLREGVQQDVLVRNVELARRLDILEHVSVGPMVHSPVSALTLMPPVDLVHAHDTKAGQAGLLLVLTRSIPYVLTIEGQGPARNPIMRAVNRRASGVIYRCDADGAKHLRIYRHAVATWRATTVAL